MGKIEYTNIIVDDFSEIKKKPFDKYVHFLTHIHTDHLKGLNPSWNYGKIYTTHITKKLLQTKFPKLSPLLIPLSLNQQHTIVLCKDLNITVTLFDANHCAGSVMMLFEGYMGRILYTGDFRFSKEIFSKYKYLYPPEKANANFQSCSKPIDVLHVDNTFLAERFNFPLPNQALRIADEFIEKCFKQKKRIIIGMQNFGKEQALIHFSKQFDTLIVVNEAKYESIIQMQYDHECFTTNPEEGNIEVVFRKQMNQKLKENDNYIGMVMTGWSNQPRMQNRTYFVPYSLHSNYLELNQFVDSIRPSFIYPIVMTGTRSESVSEKTAGQQQESGMYKAPDYRIEINFLREKYCSKVGREYQNLQNDIDLQKKICERLGLSRTTQEINRQELDMATISINADRVQRKGYKFRAERDEEEINKIKSNLKSQGGSCSSFFSLRNKPKIITPEMGIQHEIMGPSEIEEDDEYLEEIQAADFISVLKKKKKYIPIEEVIDDEIELIPPKTFVIKKDTPQELIAKVLQKENYSENSAQKQDFEKQYSPKENIRKIISPIKLSSDKGIVKRAMKVCIVEANEHSFIKSFKERNGERLKKLIKLVEGKTFEIC